MPVVYADLSMLSGLFKHLLSGLPEFDRGSGTTPSQLIVLQRSVILFDTLHAEVDN